MICISLANSTRTETLTCETSTEGTTQRPVSETPVCVLTFHEGRVGAAVVVKVSAVQVVQAVISQALCVAETLQDAVHETLYEKVG